MLTGDCHQRHHDSQHAADRAALANVTEVKRELGLLNIPLHAEDTGNSHARTVELHLETGVFVVRSYRYGEKRL